VKAKAGSQVFSGSCDRRYQAARGSSASSRFASSSPVSGTANMSHHKPVGIAAFVQCENADCISAILLYLKLQQ
jgi:hypothetical protein